MFSLLHVECEFNRFGLSAEGGVLRARRVVYGERTGWCTGIRRQNK